MFNACRPLKLPLMMASLGALSACSTLQPQAPRLTVPASLKAPCERPVAAFATLGELGAYTVRLKGAADCETARADSLVTLIEAWGQITHPKRRWWPFKLPDG